MLQFSILTGQRIMSPALTALQLFLNAVPESVHGRATAAICNHLLKGQHSARRLEALEGRRLWLTISDTATTLRYRFANNSLHYDGSRQAPDIHIRGKLVYLLQMATRNEDPDTLFFARHLSMEGSTEDGLILKNFLDAMEFDTEAHLKAWLGKFLAQRAMPVIRTLKPGQRLQAIAARLT